MILTDEAIDKASRAICAVRGCFDDRPCDLFGGDRAAQCHYPGHYAEEARAALTSFVHPGDGL